MSQITTHILDTTLGKPAKNVSIVLQQKTVDNYENMATGITNTDGRIANLLAADVILKPGIYRLVFDTASYFKMQQVEAFYPSVSIDFEIKDNSHYHVPLLLNPFGYSTYRGS
jgi:hydroxyisourate hydrolase